MPGSTRFYRGEGQEIATDADRIATVSRLGSVLLHRTTSYWVAL